VIITAIFAAPAVTAASLDALARRLALPMPLGQQLLDALAAGDVVPGIALPRATLDSMDPARPMTFVRLTSGIGVEEGGCAALTFRDADAARRALGALGQETSRAGAESERKLVDGSKRWAGVHGRTLLLSDKPRTISIAGPLAEELQERPNPATAAVTVYPHVIVPLDVAGVRALIDAKGPTFFEDLAKRGGKGGPKLDVSVPGFLAALRLLAEPLVETRALTVALDVDPRVGFSARIVIEPVAESTFARSLVRRFPFTAPNGQPAGASGGYLSWGGFADFLETIGPVLSASGPRGRAARAANAALTARLTGAVSCAIDRGPPIVTRCDYPLAPGAKPADVLNRYAASMRGSVGGMNELFGTQSPPPIVTNKGGVLEIEQRLDPSLNPAYAAIFGTSSQRSAAVVRGGMLVVAQGAEPRRVLDAAPTVSPQPALSAALERAHGANLVAYVDVASLALALATSSPNPDVKQGLAMVRAIPGLEQLRFPLVASARSGATAQYELEIPIEGLESAARIVVPYMGTMGKPR
jgi:hypothetical protein